MRPEHPTDTRHLPPECPACGEPIDYCQGHGDIGDPLGADILRRHDDGDHAHCLTICSPSEH